MTARTPEHALREALEDAARDAVTEAQKCLAKPPCAMCAGHVAEIMKFADARVAAYRNAVAALAAGVQASADATRPSKKTQTEDEIAISLRKLLEPETPGSPGQQETTTKGNG